MTPKQTVYYKALVEQADEWSTGGIILGSVSLLATPLVGALVENWLLVLFPAGALLIAGICIFKGSKYKKQAMEMLRQDVISEELETFNKPQKRYI